MTMRSITKVLARRLGALAVTVLAGGLLTAALVRFSPGFGVDERELDPRLNEASRISIQQQSAADRDILGFYRRRLEAMLLHGDLGKSPSLGRPIAELLRERLSVTAQIMAIGLVGGWALAFGLALPSVMCRSLVIRGFTGLSQQVLMCLPAAALAIVVFNYGGPVRALVALAVCPRVFEYLRNLLLEAYAQPHILTARAKGLGGAAIWMKHVMPYVAPQLLAMAGVSVSIAFGATIPVEALCDLPGVGQLAWMAATSRDLPLLVTITFLVIAMTQVCNTMSDWAVLHG
jgi:peptide/nickel transport system permease protein